MPELRATESTVHDKIQKALPAVLIAVAEHVLKEAEARKAERFARRLDRFGSSTPQRRKIRNWLSQVPRDVTKDVTVMPTKEEEHALLKAHLAITPKTISLLYDSGYTTPSSLRSATPNEVAAKFAARPGMDWKSAKNYVRPLRRMVMLGDIEDLEEAKAAGKKLQKWSKVELVRSGVWEEVFDDLTGMEIHRRMREAGAMPGKGGKGKAASAKDVKAKTIPSKNVEAKALPSQDVEALAI